MKWVHQNIYIIHHPIGWSPHIVIQLDFFIQHATQRTSDPENRIWVCATCFCECVIRVSVIGLAQYQMIQEKPDFKQPAGGWAFLEKTICKYAFILIWMSNFVSDMLRKHTISGRTIYGYLWYQDIFEWWHCAKSAVSDIFVSHTRIKISIAPTIYILHLTV